MKIRRNIFFIILFIQVLIVGLFLFQQSSFFHQSQDFVQREINGSWLVQRVGEGIEKLERQWRVLPAVNPDAKMDQMEASVRWYGVFRLKGRKNSPSISIDWVRSRSQRVEKTEPFLESLQEMSKSKSFFEIGLKKSAWGSLKIKSKKHWWTVYRASSEFFVFSFIDSSLFVKWLSPYLKGGEKALLIGPKEEVYYSHENDEIGMDAKKFQWVTDWKKNGERSGLYESKDSGSALFAHRVSQAPFSLLYQKALPFGEWVTWWRYFSVGALVVSCFFIWGLLGFVLVEPKEKPLKSDLEKESETLVGVQNPVDEEKLANEEEIELEASRDELISHPAEELKLEMPEVEIEKKEEDVYEQTQSLVFTEENEKEIDNLSHKSMESVESESVFIRKPKLR